MTKYLFLLGLCLFSISFLSTPVVAGEIYAGIVYSNYDKRALSCTWVGMRDMARTENNHGCQRGAFSSFIFFIEDETYANYSPEFKYIHSFISVNGGRTWNEAYLRVKRELQILNCKESNKYKGGNNRDWVADCNDNFASYEAFKHSSRASSVFEGAGLEDRAPDSIKE